MTYTLPKEGQPFTDLAEGRTLEFEEESYSLSFGKQGPIESDVLRVVYSSFVTPESTIDFNMITGTTADAFYGILQQSSGVYFLCVQLL